MALSTLEHDVLAKSFAVAKTVLNDLQPKLASLQQLYDAEGGVSTTLTQEELDAVAALSGLTVQQVSDGMYVLTTILLPGIVQGYPALAQLAARFL